MKNILLMESIPEDEFEVANPCVIYEESTKKIYVLTNGDEPTCVIPKYDGSGNRFTKITGETIIDKGNTGLLA